MAVTVTSRPEGYKLSTETISAYVDDVSGNARVVKAAHGLSTGQTVYAESNIDAYNGFKKVGGTITDSFFILDMDGDSVDFKQQVNIFYYVSELDHGWQCVHLPIFYELESDLYPVNSVDTAEPSSGYGFINGYFAVVTLNPVSFNALDYVKVGDGAGGYRIFQVIEAYSSTITVLNSDGTGAFEYIQLYRNNYHVLVNVYAGLPAGHPWETEKPYELASTLRFIPDSDNRIKFSIAEILKGYIITRNNLTLDTLPNNIDFMTAFYIEFAEAYDVSDGTEITVFEDEFEEDDFEGYAVNAMLPFKNIYSGWMSEYVDSGSILARWLTTMDVPLIFVGYFFDLSFINTHSGEDIKINKNGVLYLTIDDPGIGVLRVPIEAEAGDTELCIQAYIGEGDTEYTISSFVGGVDWTIAANATVDLAPLVSSSVLSQPVSKDEGTYTISWDITVTGVDGIFSIKYMKDGVLISNFGFSTATPGSNVGSKSITLTDSADEITFQITNGGGGIGDSTYVLNGITISGENYITERICLRVVSECDTFIADDLRLIETGPFRELE